MNDSLIGRTMGNYRLLHFLGKEDGIFRTYVAEHLNLERQAAVKIMGFEEFPEYGPEVVGEFELDARMQARLEHPNIVPIFDYGKQDDYFYSAIRLLTGGTLRERLEAH